MEKVHFKQRDYVEKLCSCKISTLVFIDMKHTLRGNSNIELYPVTAVKQVTVCCGR